MRVVVWVAVVAVLVVAGPAVGQDRKPDIRAKLKGHYGGVSSIAFDHKGDRIATGAGNGIVRLWDANSGLRLAKVDDRRHDSAAITLVAFSADGQYLSAASKTMVGVWDVADPKKISFRYEDGYSPEPGKTGAITGSGKRVYFTGTDAGSLTLRSYTLATHSLSSSELPPKFTPWALAPIPDPDSGLVAVYGLSTIGDKGEPAIALVGLGDPRVIGRGAVMNTIQGLPVTVSFSPDSHWLVICNGAEVMYWPVPGSHVLRGNPKKLANVKAYVAAVGPQNQLAVASPPEDGEKVTVTIYDLGSADPKPVATYATNIDRVSALAFSPDGMTLAVGDDVEGVVQLWAMPKK